MNTPEIIGLAGAIIAGVAYLPQIIHLIKEKCSAGISQGAFALWVISSILITINAYFIESIPFMVLGIIQICSTLIILIFSFTYKGKVCEFHKTQALGK